MAPVSNWPEKKRPLPAFVGRGPMQPLAHRRLGYPSAGCTSAEPASVSPSGCTTARHEAVDQRSTPAISSLTHPRVHGIGARSPVPLDRPRHRSGLRKVGTTVARGARRTLHRLPEGQPKPWTVGEASGQPGVTAQHSLTDADALSDDVLHGVASGREPRTRRQVRQTWAGLPAQLGQQARRAAGDLRPARQGFKVHRGDGRGHEGDVAAGVHGRRTAATCLHPPLCEADPGWAGA